MTVFAGEYLAHPGKIAIVVSRFNEAVTGKLLGGAQDMLHRHEVNDDDIDVVWVPGAFEISGMVRQLLATNRYAGVVTLGAVIRGETSHYDYVCNEVAKGVGQLALNSDAPVVFGVLTTDTLEQAQQRAGGKAGNKGSDVAADILELIDLHQQLANA
ncbi:MULTISPECIES: 6,7-dimethyl-8-ribityllumazine synthase [Furfurilactobacillus]|uniref:6,7-dimethyl-8-ribityllumazine synthase n=2 Tax=Furfurilactobacillus TaxID=2767882 RepID=A0ABT6DBM1_9LACO|nr:6,7-dimethyl-8-ribityllumazine synthase [Furfurilactobacillus milii]QLE65473.1 67-dimethyl-8-ribityllumazine synthase [Furfurilactobacillus rossiae]MCF6160971.1 6,7-dimethyl-8-ribityllumazine synthase [Furfurilactobacillus milii]MCF6163263.1 6,7-dimethyl-8-ribityllumazine synthase [Furfurilactobacillus milii]MDF9913918.1 6,7-dimethyl-8-ribityllumazine synthase [Furfurilactobacillus milii]MYV04322.1 6,7-dimethyl-8-ribityllumazine synthase [Furfurilactobacillus milii]